MSKNDAHESAQRSFFSGEVDAFVVTCYENERPLQGLVGFFDWRLGGAISNFVKTGAVTGKAGECVYFPVEDEGKTLHLILVGAGHSSNKRVGETSGSSARTAPPAATIKNLQKNLENLKLGKIGISKSDFGMEIEKITGGLADKSKRVELCILL